MKDLHASEAEELKPIYATLQQAEGSREGLGYSAARYLPGSWWKLTKAHDSRRLFSVFLLSGFINISYANMPVPKSLLLFGMLLLL